MYKYMSTIHHKKTYRLLLKSADFITQRIISATPYNYFSNVTFSLAGMPQHIINEMVQSPELEVKCAWFKIFGYPGTTVPFMLALPGLSHNKTLSSTTKTGTDYLVYGEYGYQLFDWEGITGIFTSDYQFLRDKSLRVQFLNPTTETELSADAFTSTSVNYILSLLIVY